MRRPFHLAYDGAGLVRGGVVFSKLSKLLNQEDALSAPCLRGDFCSPQTISRYRAKALREGHLELIKEHRFRPNAKDEATEFRYIPPPAAAQR